MTRFKYQVGDKIGPSQLVLLERTTKDSQGNWQGKFKCPYCGEIFETRIYRVQERYPISCGCLHQKVLKQQSERTKKNIEGEIVNNQQAIRPTEKRDTEGKIIWEIKCLLCGRSLYKTVSHFHVGTMCQCELSAFNQRKESSRRPHLEGQRFGKLTVLAEHPSRSPYGEVLWDCICDCGNKKITTTSALTHHSTVSCGCLNSFHENLIARLLTEKDIIFVSQWSNDECRYPETKRLLYFDFYLPKYNACIEYDGEQHFKPVAFFGGEEGFEERKKRDLFKNSWCERKGIPLLRLSYQDNFQDIESKLNKYLAQLISLYGKTTDVIN